MNLGRLQSGLVRRINRFRPFRTTTAARLAAANPTCWQAIYPAWQADWPRELPSGPLPEVLAQRLSSQLPERGVLRLRNASVLGDHGWVFTADNRLVVDTSGFIDTPEFIPRLHCPLLRRGARELSGRTLSLLSNWGASNFYHMQLDVFPRVDLLLLAGWDWKDFDHILLPDFRSPTVDRQLERLGLPEDRVIRVQWGPLNYFRTEELVCTSFPGGRRSVLPTTVAYLRSLNQRPPSPATRRLFVRRRARTRHLRNEDELLPLLLARGFEIYDPGVQGDVESAFHAAAYVVGAHGAGLANLVFSQTGAKVLELVPSDQAYPFFYTLCMQAGIGYDCLLGPSDDENKRHPNATWNSPHDFTVDAAAFARSLDRLLAT